MKKVAWICFLLAAPGCGRQTPAEKEAAADTGPARVISVDGGPGQGMRTVTNSIGMDLALLPPGEFLMGSPDTDLDAREDEKPRHRVRITRPFYMGRYEVTQEEYQRVMGTNPSFFSPTGHGKDRVAGLNAGRFPAEQVRWHDAVAFCARLSELPAEKEAGRVYRLPTEAEWEYACRAGTTTPFSAGDSLSSLQANFNGNNPAGGAARGPFLARTSAVGSYAPNAWGLYDMHGNVWEWCADWYGRTYYRESPSEDPAGPATGSSRVIRGGEWYGDGRDCRSAFRYADLPDGIFYVMGFRVVMTAAGSGPAVAARSDPVARDPGPRPAADPVRRDPGPTAAGEDWPCWRGPRGDGTWKGPMLRELWPETGLRRLWRQPVGGGYAGVAAAGGRVWTLDYRKGPEESERVLCFDAATGKPLWEYPYPVRYKGLSYGNGPRTTPTVLDGRVCTLGAVGHLFCLDASTGKPLWSRDLVREEKAQVPNWGFSASPLVFEDLLIVHAGAEKDGCFLALDRQTGKEAWRSLPDPAGYANPILADSHGTRQLVCWTPTNVHGLDPRTGRRLWTVPFTVTYGTSIATPIFQEGLVLVSSYYEGTKAIRPGAAPEEAAVVWQDKRNLRGLMSQPLYRDGHVYLLDKQHGLTCFALGTGAKVWDDGNRLTPKGRNPQATLVWAGDGDQALALNSDGDLVLVRLSPAGYQELARANVIGPTWAHPAFAGDCVYARSDEELVCVELPVVRPTPAAGHKGR
jgi:formylglycine-generating enzyme required for sulfatase activity/outer membrane protein assembly factor BamB